MTAEKKKPYFHVAAGVILNKGKILITRRPEGTHLAGMWEFPGGKKRQEENLEECLRREINEELGIDIRVGAPISSVEHEYEQKKVTLHFYYCSVEAGAPMPLEGQVLEWVSPKSLDDYLFPPPDRELINHLKKGPDHET